MINIIPIIIISWDEGWKTAFKHIHRFTCILINVALTLIGYRKPPKLVPVVGFSIIAQRNETEAASNRD